MRDFGTDSEKSCDYPDFIRPVAEAVARRDVQRGIVLGGSGNGEAIVANRVVGVRCAICWSEYTTLVSRQHNDANCMSIGERTISEEDALRFVQLWLATDFEAAATSRGCGRSDGVY